MASNRSYTIIGGFVLGALVLATVAVIALGGIRLFSQPRQAIIFFNQSVLGLSNGSRVLFRGVQIGTVKNVQLRLGPKAGKARIAVTIEVTGNDVVMLNGQNVPNNVTTRQLVKRGLRAQLVVWSYVTSELAVNLSFHPENKPNYVGNTKKLEFPEIPAMPSEIEQLKKTVTKVPWKKTLRTFNQTMQSMLTLTDDMDNTMDKFAPNLEQTNHGVQKTLTTVRQAIQANNKQLQATLRSVRKLTDNANERLVSRDKQLDTLLDNVQQTSHNINKLSKNLKTLTDPGSDTRENFDSAMRDLSASAANLRQFTETIERDPHALLFGGPNS